MDSEAANSSVELNWIDFTVIGAYLIVTFIIGIVSAVKEQKKSKGSSTGYFLAGRSMSWWTIALSLYMSNIGSNTFIGTAGSAAANGFGVLCYEFVGIYSLLLLAYMFVPVYLTSGAFTMPEYIRKRFGGRRMQMLLSVQSLLMYVFAKLSLEVYAGALIIQNTMGWNELLSISSLLLMTAAYTMVGGLTTVIITDAVQGIIVVIGSGILAVMSVNEIGGIGELQSKFLNSYPSDYNNITKCGEPDLLAFHLLRDITDKNYPWLGAFVGANILSAWHWCTDQLFVQRTLAARSLQHAKAGSVAAGFLKILPLILMILPGMISRILYTDTVACVSPETCKDACGIAEGCSNVAYVEIIKNLLPQGFRGVMIAAMLAALISSITSIFNSGSTLFTIDIWTRYRSHASELEKLIVGRIFIVVLTIIGVLWLPIVRTSGGGQLVIYAQSVTSYLTPPILSVFLLASLWPRTTEPAVFFGLLVSMLIGIIWMILNFIFTPAGCGEIDLRPSWIANLHFLHFAIILFVASLILMILISLLTEPIPMKELKDLTLFTQNKEEIVSDETVDNNEALDVNLSEINSQTITEAPDVNLSEINSERIDEAPDNNIKVCEPASRRFLKFFLRWFCNLSNENQDSDSKLKNQQIEQKQIEQKAKQLRMELRGGTRSDRLVNICAFILFAIGCFLWGYFA